MNIWTKENILNYTSVPDEAKIKKHPKELQAGRNALREEIKAAKKYGGTVDWYYLLSRMERL